MHSIGIILTFLTGLFGGVVFNACSLPLPWILGPACAIMILNAARPGKALWPDRLGHSGVAVVAYLLGRTLTIETVIMIAYNLPWMVMAAAGWVLFCILVGWTFAKLARIHPVSAMLGCVPGGLSQMVLISERFKRADPGIVAIIQTSRLIIVLYTVPFLATWIAQPSAISQEVRAAAMPSAGFETAAAMQWPPSLGFLLLILVPLSVVLMRYFRVPAGEFLGPVLLVGALSIAGCPWPAVPDPLLAAAQLAIGIYIGKRVQMRMIWTNKRLGPLAVMAALLLVAVTAGAALLLSRLTPDSIVTWFLALAPGGLGEVAVTALLLGADVSQVTAYQLSRLFFVLLAAPLIIKRLAGEAENRPEA